MSDDGMLDDGAAEVILDTEEAAVTFGNQTSDVSASGNESNPPKNNIQTRKIQTRPICYEKSVQM